MARKVFAPNAPAPHDRTLLPQETVAFPQYLREFLVCLLAHLATNTDLPTQGTRCTCGYTLGSGLKRQYARARAGVMHPAEYEFLRALGVLFLDSDARSHDTDQQIRDTPIPAIAFQSPDFTTYRQRCWTSALARVQDAVTKGIDPNDLVIDKYSKDAASLSLLLHNVLLAVADGTLPADLADGFQRTGLILDATARFAHLNTTAHVLDALSHTVSEAILDATRQGIPTPDLLVRAIHRANATLSEFGHAPISGQDLYAVGADLLRSAQAEVAA